MNLNRFKMLFIRYFFYYMNESIMHDNLLHCTISFSFKSNITNYIKSYLKQISHSVQLIYQFTNLFRAINV